MSSFAPIWNDSMTGCGNGVTNTLCTSQYVVSACNGYAFLYNAENGALVGTNNLTGVGKGEVRMAINNASQVVYFACNGYVQGVALNNFSASQWKQPTSLPKTGNNVTSVVVDNSGNIYAAANGYVFKLNSSGTVLYTNSLTGTGNNEVRLVLSTDQSVLYAGTNGQVWALATSQLSTQWNLSLSGWNTSPAANSAVSLACGLYSEGHGGGSGPLAPHAWLFAACNGMLYSFDLSALHPIVTASISLQSTCGTGDTRMVYDGATQSLYVGLSGWGLGIDASLRRSPTWKFRVYNSSGAVTNVVESAGRVYVGAGGSVAVLESGICVNIGIVSNGGMQPVGVSVAPDAPTILAAGANGYLSAFATPGTPALVGGWMGSMATQLNNVALCKIKLPGSHDSGTFAITAQSPFADDDAQLQANLEKGCEEAGRYADKISPLFGLTGMAIIKLTDWVPKAAKKVSEPELRSIAAPWAVAQGLDFLTQLQCGVRYLDLRTQVYNGNFMFVHGFVGASLQSLLGAVSQFLRQPGYGNEVILLNFNHFYDFNGTNYTAFLDTLKTSLGSLLITYPTNIANPATMTYGQVINGGSGRVVVMCDLPSDVSTANYPFVWPTKAVAPSYWPNQATPDTLLPVLDELIAGTRPVQPDVFFILPGDLTPNMAVLEASVSYKYLGKIQETMLDNRPHGVVPCSLEEQAMMFNPLLNATIENSPHQSNLNIVTCDWFQVTNFVSMIINLNRSAT
jgi:hypothetical protein